MCVSTTLSSRKRGGCEEVSSKCQKVSSNRATAQWQARWHQGAKVRNPRHFLTHFDHDCGAYTVCRLTLIGCVYIVSAWLQNIDDSSAKQRMKKMKSVNMTDTQSEAPAKKTNLRRQCCPELKRKSVASWETSSHRFHQLFNQSSVTNLY